MDFFSRLGLGRQNEEHTAEPLATEKEETAEQVVENPAIEEQVLSEKQAEIAPDNTSVEAEARESVAEHSTLAPVNGIAPRSVKSRLKPCRKSGRNRLRNQLKSL